MVFTNESTTLGGPANVQLFINGRGVGEVHLERQTRARFSTECMDVGMDNRAPVSPKYRDLMPFKFTGRIEHVTFEFDLVNANRELTPAERLEQHVRMD
ncbi:hypothetical protein D7V97_08485 [Corallococcus sp. CA053C]|nr:hypothetical protein D7V97_08485 [Corallococcus sp. CA053C]